MTLKQYFPVSVAVFALLGGLAHYYSVPFSPFAVILLTGETLLGFHLENNKVPRLLKQVFTPAKPHHS